MSDSRFPIPDSRPHRTRIKFCGFTRAEDLSTAVALGVDAVGLVCVPGSKRELSIGAASELRRSLPPFVDAVLLLSNAKNPRPRAKQLCSCRQLPLGRRHLLGTADPLCVIESNADVDSRKRMQPLTTGKLNCTVRLGL